MTLSLMAGYRYEVKGSYVRGLFPDVSYTTWILVHNMLCLSTLFCIVVINAKELNETHFLPSTTICEPFFHKFLRKVFERDPHAGTEYHTCHVEYLAEHAEEEGHWLQEELERAAAAISTAHVSQQASQASQAVSDSDTGVAALLA